MSDRRIRAYIEARRETLAFRRQLEADPTRADSVPWMRLYTEARVAVHDAMMRLTGGEIGRAEALLAATLSRPSARRTPRLPAHEEATP
jgi:hypothetical protein